jgi:hypothetical protein
MRSSSLFVAIALLGSLIGATGCEGPHEYTILVKDPGAVNVVDAPVLKSLADGAPIIDSGTHGDDAWSLVMFREHDGTLRLRCKACNRDALLVGADGVMHVTSEQPPALLGLERPAPERVAEGALLSLPYRYCGFPGRRSCAGALWEGRRVTPWSNVTEVRARRGTSQLGSPALLVGAGLVAAIGVAFIAGGAHSDHPAEQVAGIGAGGGLVSLGALFVKLFVDGKSERVIDPPPSKP